MKRQGPLLDMKIRPDKAGDRQAARLLIALYLPMLGLQVHNYLRIQAFESRQHQVLEASGAVTTRYGRGGASLLLQTQTGQIRIASQAPSMFSADGNGISESTLIEGMPVTAAWVDAPAGLVSGTTRYPVRIEQGGRVLLSRDMTSVVASQKAALALEAALIALLLFVAPLLYLFVARRQDAARVAAAFAAWRHRRESAEEAPELSSPGSASR